MVVLMVILALVVAVFSSQKHNVTRIIDGDTVEISGYETNIRLIGIDTAEEGECYRTESTKLTKDLMLGRKVRVETDENEKDNFGRVLAYIYLTDGTMANKKLLEVGAGQFFYDSVNLKYQEELVQTAEKARQSRAGLWKACGPCVVKGNYDIRGRRYYHLPEFRHYSQVVVNLDKADRWFCSEAEAINAGFIRARD